LIVGRVEKDKVECAGRGGGDPVFDGSFENRKLVAEVIQVVGQSIGGAMVMFEEKSGLGPSAEGFQAVRTSAGKKVEHP